MSELRKIVQAFMDADDRKEAWVAKEMGISRSALNGWWNRGRSSTPSADVLRSLARVTRTPYRSVLDAALLDFGYLPEEGTDRGTSAQKMNEDAESVTHVVAEPLEGAPPDPAAKPKRRTSPSRKS